MLSLTASWISRSLDLSSRMIDWFASLSLNAFLLWLASSFLKESLIGSFVLFPSFLKTFSFLIESLGSY